MHITIIGAGFSGSVLAMELAQHAGSGVEICLVGVAAAFGRGLAYGDARPEHLLNVRARDLGASTDHPGEFADWLSLSARGRAHFLPRLVYGEFLQARLQSARRLSLAAVVCIENEVVALERVGGGFRVYLADGSQFLSEQVVLAVGALPPAPLAGIGPRLAVHPSYIGSPWGDGAIDAIAPDARVLVLGTGLTMADVVATLRRREHRGPLTALSRHGLRPRRHLDDPSAAITLPAEVYAVLRTHDLLRLVRVVRELGATMGDWRTLIDALRPQLQTLWRGLPDAQRARFLRHLRPYWESVRHRLAPQTAAELDALQVSGQLRVQAGHLLRARRGAQAVETLIRPRGSSKVRTAEFDVVIRATGFDTDLRRTTDPLMSHLREAGWLSGDRFGLGVNTTERYEVIDAGGVPVRGLYCLGPLLRGRLWEITAVPELRVAARALARQLVPASPRRQVTPLPVTRGERASVAPRAAGLRRRRR